MTMMIIPAGVMVPLTEELPEVDSLEGEVVMEDPTKEMEVTPEVGTQEVMVHPEGIPVVMAEGMMNPPAVEVAAEVQGMDLLLVLEDQLELVLLLLRGV